MQERVDAGVAAEREACAQAVELVMAPGWKVSGLWLMINGILKATANHIRSRTNDRPGVLEKPQELTDSETTREPSPELLPVTDATVEIERMRSMTNLIHNISAERDMVHERGHKMQAQRDLALTQAAKLAEALRQTQAVRYNSNPSPIEAAQRAVDQALADYDARYTK